MGPSGFWHNVGSGYASPFVVVDRDLRVAIGAIYIDFRVRYYRPTDGGGRHGGSSKLGADVSCVLGVDGDDRGLIPRKKVCIQINHQRDFPGSGRVSLNCGATRLKSIKLS